MVIASNSRPVLTVTGRSLTFTENGGPVLLAADASASDLDGTTLSGATISISSGYQAGQDFLSYTAAAGITAAWDSSRGVLTFSGVATLKEYNTTLRSVGFYNTSDTPATGLRTIEIQVNDGKPTDSLSTPAIAQVQVVPTNDAPVLSVPPVTTINDTLLNSAIAIAPSLNLNDGDSAVLTSATVTVAGNYRAAQDVLGFTAMFGMTGSFNSANGVLTISGTGSVAEYQAALRAVTYANTGAGGMVYLDRAISFQVNDGAAGGLSTPAVVKLQLGAPPAITIAGAATFIENIAAPIAPGLTLIDQDDVTLQGATVTIASGREVGDSLVFMNQNGIAGSFNSSTGALTLSGAASVSAYETALRSVAFVGTSETPLSSKSITWQVNDGTSPAPSITQTLTVTALNDAPVLNGGGNVDFIENGPAVILWPGATVTDVDTPTFTGGSIKVAVTANWSAGDMLGVRHQGTAAGQISVTGTSIIYGGAMIGTMSGGADGLPLTITLTKKATLAAVQALLRDITYTSTSEGPAPGGRTVTFTVIDGAGRSNGGFDTATSTTTVNVLVVNDAPVLSLGAPLAYTENAAPSAIAPGATLADIDSPDFSGGSLKVSLGLTGTPADQLGILSQGGITAGAGLISYNGTAFASYTGGSGGSDLVITFSNAHATQAAAQALVRAISFYNESDDPATTRRDITFTLVDGDGAALGGADTASATAGVKVMAVNDAPAVTTSGGNASFTENAPAVVVDGGLTLADPDNTMLQGATVRIASGLQSGDSLNFIAQNGITGTYNAGTGVLTLTGTASKADYQAALRSVTFGSTHDNPGAAKTLEFTVTDGALGSNAATRTVAVTAVNDAPVNTVPEAQTINEDGSLVFSGATGTALMVSDADAPDLMINVRAQHGTLRLSAAASESGVLLFETGSIIFAGHGTGLILMRGTAASINAALDGLVYTADANYNGTDTVRISTNDDGGSGAGGPLVDTDDVAITINAVNDAPRNTVPGAQTVNEDVALVFSDANGNAISVADVDADTLQVTITATHGSLTLSGTTGLVFSAGDGTQDGTMTLTGSIVNINTALQGLAFLPAANFNGAASLTIATSDLGATGTGGTLADTKTIGVTVGAVNDAPVNSVPATQTMNEDGVLVFSAANGNKITVADIDAAETIGAEITVRLSTVNGTITLLAPLSPVQMITGDGTDDRVIEFKGAADDVNDALANITFKADANFNGEAQLDISTDDGGATGGASLSDADRVYITVNPVNDAPVLTGSSDFANIDEDTLTSKTLVSTLVTMSDIDTGAAKGLAIHQAGVLAGGGKWQYSLNGTDFFDVASVTSSTALLLAADDYLRFVPDGQNAATATLGFYAWDQSNSATLAAGDRADVTLRGGTTAYSSLGGSSNLTVNAVNDAPVLTAHSNFASITEDDVTNTTVVSSLFTKTDVDQNAASGIAIYGVTAGNGQWQYSLDGTQWIDLGTVSTGSALLLADDDNLRFVGDTKNGTEASISFYAWDRSNSPGKVAGDVADVSLRGGSTAYSSAGRTSNLTVTSVNDAPILQSTLPFADITEDDATNATLVSSLLGRNTDVDTGALVGIAVTQLGSGNGTWQYSLDGTSWNDIGVVGPTSALLLADDDYLRFVPDGKNAEEVWIDFVTWDRSNSGLAAGDLANVTVRGGTTAYSASTGTGLLTVTSVNDAPTLSGTAGALAITEGDAPVVIDSGIIAGDVDNEDADLEGAVVSISQNFQPGDQLVFVNQNGISGAYNTANGTLTLSGTSSQAHYQAALRSITFSTTHDDPAASKVIAFTVSDGTVSSASVTRTITITPVNDAPLVDLFAGGAVDNARTVGTYIENVEAFSPLSDIDLIDGDSLTLSGAVVTLTNMQPGDVLSVIGAADGSVFGIGIAVNANVVTFTGSASRLSYIEALKAVSFTNTGDNPDATPRTFTVQVDDGATVFNLSVSATATLLVEPVNDAPVFSSAASVAVNEGSSLVMTLAVTDPDGAAPVYTVSGGDDAALFEIRNGNQLHFKLAPSYETPLDAGAGNVYDVSVLADDGSDTTPQDLVVTVANLSPSAPVDGDAADNKVSKAAPQGTLVRIDVNSTDAAGGTVTYSLLDDADGRFQIDPATGVVTVLGEIVYDEVNTGNNFVTIRVRAADPAGLGAETDIAIEIIPNTPPVANDDTGEATEAGVAAAIDATGNVISGLGKDTDNEDDAALVALVVTAVGRGTEASPGTMGSVGQALAGEYGTLTLSASGAYTYSVDPNNATVDALQAGGTLTDNFHYTVTDSVGATGVATLVITVNGANDAPASYSGWSLATEDSPGTISSLMSGSDVDGSIASFRITVLPTKGDLYTDEAGTQLLSVGSVVMPFTTNIAGIYYKPRPDASGSDSYSFVAVDNDNVASTPETNTITIAAVNDAPAFTVGATQTVLEDAGAQSVSGFLTAITAGPADESAQTVGFTVANNNSALFALQPAIDSTGKLSYTPAANANGVATVTVYAYDDGGLAGGNAVVSATQTFTINVTAVNDAPSFTPGTDITVPEEAGNVISPNWAMNRSAGAGETGQALRFTTTVTGTTGPLTFAQAPSVNATTGTLTFRAADNTFGTATVNVTLTDDNGTPADTSDDLSTLVHTMTITVLNTDDAPTAVDDSLSSVNEDSGAVVISTSTLLGNDYDIDNYPLDNTGLSVTNIANPVNGTLSVDAGTGQTTFTPDANFNGTASFDYTITDGSATDTATASFTVVAMNDAPVVTLPSSVGTAFSNTPLAITGLSVTDIDAAQGSNPASVTVSATHGTVSFSATTGVTATSANGVVTLTGALGAVNTALASLQFTGEDGVTAGSPVTAVISVLANDGGNHGNPGALSSNGGVAQTFNVGVVPQVWYIDNSAGGTGGTGTSADPFRSVADFNSASGPGVNDYIYVRAGTYTGAGINLKDGQTLLGANESLSLFDPVKGQSVQVEAGGGGRPTISVNVVNDQAIDLASGNTIRGINLVTAASTSGLDDGSNDVGSLSVANMSISGAGKAIDIDNGGNLASVVLESVGSTGFAGSTTNAIDLQGLSGSITINGGSLAGAGAATVNVAGSSLNVNLNSMTISQGNNAAAFSVSGGHTGTVTIGSGANATTISANAGTGLQFSDADGTYNFNGSTTLSGGDAGIDILSGSGGNFTFGSATNVTSPTGTAFNINGGTAVVTYNGSLTQASNNAALVSITDHATGTVTFQGGSLSATAGTGLQFTNADGVYNFNGTTALNSASTGDAGIDILAGSDVSFGSKGTFTFGTGTSINNSASTNAAFLLSGSDATVTYSGSIVDNNGRAVSIDEHDGGAITFQTGSITANGSGATGIAVTNSNGGSVVFNGQTTLTTVGNAAVTLTSNSNGIVNFGAAGSGLDITTTSGNGFYVTGGGTIAVTGTSNSISSAGGIALNVADTTISSSDLSFTSISATGGTSGIILSNTGSVGGLNITGDGSTAASGGTIQNTSGIGISIDNSGDFNLSLMRVTNTGGHGVWLQNLNGTNTLAKTTLENFNAVNTSALWWQNTANRTDTLNMDAVRVANQTNANGSSAVVVRTYAGGNLDFNVVDSNTTDSFKSEYVNIFGSAINLSAGDTSGDGFAVDLDVVVSNTTFKDSYVSGVAGGSSNLEMTAAGFSHLDYTIQNNRFDNVSRANASGNAGIINLNTKDSGTVGTAGDYSVITGNVINNLGTSENVVEAGYMGIRLAFDNSAAVSSYVGITNNTITDVWRQGVLLSSRDKSTLYAVIDNNIIGSAGTTAAGTTGAVGLSARRGLEIETQATSVMYVSVTNNGIYGAGTSDSSAAVAITAGASAASTSTLNATVTGNTISNVNAANTGGYFRAQTGNVSPTTQATLNIDLRNNTLPDDSKTYGLTNNGGTINVEGAGTGTVTSAGIDAANVSGVGNIVGAVTYNGNANVTAPTYNPLLAASIAMPGQGDQPQALGAVQLAQIVDAAVQRWALAGLSTEQLQALGGVQFAVADLQGAYLGASLADGIVLIDSDAAGWGWFVDATPLDDSEFFGAPGGANAGRMDLLSVVTHEIGHLLGFEDLYGVAADADGLMHAYLQAGERRVVAADVIHTETVAPELLGMRPSGPYGEAGY